MAKLLLFETLVLLFLLVDCWSGWVEAMVKWNQLTSQLEFLQREQQMNRLSKMLRKNDLH